MNKEQRVILIANAVMLAFSVFALYDHAPEVTLVEVWFLIIFCAIGTFASAVGWIGTGFTTAFLSLIAMVFINSNPLINLAIVLLGVLGILHDVIARRRARRLYNNFR